MHKKIIEKELEGFGIRLNKKPPKVILRKKEKGGIDVIENKKLTKISVDSVKKIMREYKLSNCDITFN